MDQLLGCRTIQNNVPSAGEVAATPVFLHPQKVVRFFLRMDDSRWMGRWWGQRGGTGSPPLSNSNSNTPPRINRRTANGTGWMADRSNRSRQTGAMTSATGYGRDKTMSERERESCAGVLQADFTKRINH